MEKNTDRLNVNINKVLMTRLRVIAAIEGKTVTELVIDAIKKLVETKSGKIADNVKEIFTTQNNNSETTLQTIAEQFPNLVFTSDDGKRYLRKRKEIDGALKANGITAKVSQPVKDTKRQKGYELPPTGQESFPTETDKDTEPTE